MGLHRGLPQSSQKCWQAEVNKSRSLHAGQRVTSQSIGTRASASHEAGCQGRQAGANARRLAHCLATLHRHHPGQCQVNLDRQQLTVLQPLTCVPLAISL